MNQRLVIRHEWAPGARISGDADKVAVQLAALTEQEGELRLDSVVAANMSEDAPLHNDFEWDDSAAAHLYRLGEAGHAVRSLRRIAVNTRTEEEEPPERVYVPRKVVMAADDIRPSGYTYVPLVIAQTDDEHEGRLRATALGRIERLITEFQSIAALADLAGDLADLLMKYR